MAHIKPAPAAKYSPTIFLVFEPDFMSVTLLYDVSFNAKCLFTIIYYASRVFLLYSCVGIWGALLG